MNTILFTVAMLNIGLALYFHSTDQIQEAVLAMTWAIFATLAAQGGTK